MAAFTSTGSGNWNNAATWGGGGYPGDGVSGVNDTWTIANTHVVTMPWGVTSLPAIVGAGVINLGGELAWAAGFTSAFSIGNITVTGLLSSPSDANANAKVLWMGDGTTNPVITVSNANTAEINLQKSTKIYYGLLTQFAGGIYVNSDGKFSMTGTSSASKDCMIQGASGKECYVYISGNSTFSDIGGLNNCTFDFCGQYSATFKGSLNMSIVNVMRKAQFTIGNIDITNVPSGNWGLYGQSVNFPSTTGTITATASNSYAIYLLDGYIDGGTFVGTSTSGAGIYFQQVLFNNGTATGTSTSSYGLVTFAMIMNAGTISGTSSTNFGIYGNNVTMNGGTATGTSGSNIGSRLVFWSHSGGTLNGVSTTYIGIGCLNSCELHGGKWDAYSSAYGFYSAFFGFKHFGGSLIIRDGTTGFRMTYSQDVTYQKTGTKSISIRDNGAEFSFETLWRGNEPLIYKNHASNKTCNIYFPCSPWNDSDFTTTGTVDFGDTTAGSITIAAAGGTVTFPEVQPWDVAAWDTVSWNLGAAGNTPVFEYRYSTDNGSSWSAWTVMTTPEDISGISCGLNGNDIIQVKITNPAGAVALGIVNLSISFAYARETSPDYSEEAEGPMFFPTYAKCACYFTVWGTMPDDATSVTATLYKDDGSTETLTSATATQKAGTAQWYWSTTNITTQPTTLTHYRIQFKDQNNNKVYRDIYFGGTEDDIIKTRINAGLIPALL